MSTEKEPRYNATCPACGQETLVATVQAVNEHVPLRPEDYDFDEGVPTETEMLEVHCTECLKVFDRNHYFLHGPGGGSPATAWSQKEAPDWSQLRPLRSTVRP